MILNEIVADVSSQLDQQAGLGVQIRREHDVPETGPANRGLWYQIPNVTAVFADLKRSTELNANDGAQAAAYAYTYFIRAMTVIMERFSARYVDIQGDGIFGLFSGSTSQFEAAACAITMKTQVEGVVADRFKKSTSSAWELSAGIGIDRGTLLVRRLGLRGTKENEVWAGKPVNMAAKLSSVADPNQIAVSERVFSEYENSSRLRRRALIWSCGCSGEVRQVSGDMQEGLDLPIGTTTCLWRKEPAPGGLGFDFDHIHRLNTLWCKTHGPEFCEAIVTGKRAGR